MCSKSELSLICKTVSMALPSVTVRQVIKNAFNIDWDDDERVLKKLVFIYNLPKALCVREKTRSEIELNLRCGLYCTWQGILYEAGHPWIAWIRGWLRTQPGHPWIRDWPRTHPLTLYIRMSRLCSFTDISYNFSLPQAQV